ncbi:polyunsaturated fatty acid 5-lipoxygenase-like isoform X2 [Amphibalanus amphitrite]|uniref:polyunsaturated fatty acid 5-lipoxygenase-like isoform X2 n=1 Tax=Amphibalanus amphitrite TaxID=1232801 RepID=UPI001C90DFD8|nr:polyunsaturated fatty acid 5-lipoxygenase-like isoform X2 [Amphibalanus amphitrite]
MAPVPSSQLGAQPAAPSAQPAAPPSQPGEAPAQPGAAPAQPGAASAMFPEGECDLQSAVRPSDRFVVTVHTGDRQAWSGGASESHVFAQFRDAAGRDSPFFSLPYLSSTRPGSVDFYILPHVSGLGAIATLLLRRRGRQDGDAWLVDAVGVTDRRLRRRHVFPVHRWLEAGFQMRLDEFDCRLPQDVLDREMVTQRARELVDRRALYEYAQIFKEGPVQLYYEDDDLPFEECPSFIELDELTDEINEMMVLQSPTFCTHEKWSSFLELQKACANTLGLPTAALHWTTDIWFGLQRVQGVNAKLITLCTTIPRNFGVSASMVNPFLEGLTLGEALAANRIFIVDLHILEGILPEERVRPTDYLKQLCAPIALFYLNKHNVLLPIAIQLYQYSGKRNPVFLPSDPANLWLLAKMYFNCSEAQHHTVLTHMGLGRLLMEGVAVCTQRNLSPSHPLHRLLAPHFRHLMITNAVTVEELLEPGMWMYEFMMLKGAGVQELMRRGKASWRLDLDGVVPRQVAARGVSEPSVLPHYPYRDDATALHAAIERYVRACLEPYYTDETRVAGDWELLQWRRELVRPAQKGGLGLRGVPGDMVAGFTTLDHVVETATAFISTVTVGHAAATLGLYEEAGFVPGYPLMLHGLPPRSKEQTPSTAELLERLPGRCHTWFIMLLWKLFSSPRAPRLADPRHRWLLDPASTEAAARLRKELEELSRKIARRNATVPFPYQWLDPRLSLPNCVPRAVVSKKADY